MFCLSSKSRSLAKKVLFFCLLPAAFSGCSTENTKETDFRISQQPTAVQTKLDSIESLRYVNLGDSLLVRREFLDAVAAYNTAIERFPDQPSALKKRAWIKATYLTPQDTSNWLSDWKKAQKIAPNPIPEWPQQWSPFSE